MKSPFALLLVAMMLPLGAPLAHAQDVVPEPVPLLTDTADDVQMTVQGSPEPTNGRWAAADLRGLAVKETEESFSFTVSVGNLKASPEVPFVEGTSYFVTFLMRDRIYQVVINRQVIQEASYGTRLQAYDPGRANFYTVSNAGTVQADSEKGTLTAVYARDLFLDADGTAPMPEIPFTGWHATATSNINTQQCNIGLGPSPATSCPKYTVSDRMPDQGNGTVDLPIHFGAVQTGHARLASDNPTRASNGEATTFVFQAMARNLAVTKDTFNLGASGVPAGWEVKLPAPSIDVPGNGTVVFPVLLTTQFQHAHGTLQHFQLELRSTTDPSSVGRLQLGIRYSQPPQPAGHHDVLTLHSEDFSGADPINTAASVLFNGGSFTQAYMNAEPSDPNDAGVEVMADNYGYDNFNVPGGTPQNKFVWTIPLSPGLELGLDFDVTGTGQLDIHVKNVAPVQGAVFSGEIIHYSAPNDTAGQGNNIPRGGQAFGDTRIATVVATLTATAPVDLAPNSADTQIKIEVKPTAAGDYVAYQKGASLEMSLNLTGITAQAFFGPQPRPTLLPGGTMKLPLTEYHDLVTQVFASSTVELVAKSAQDRVVNPGKSALYNLTLVNHGAAATFNLDMSGTHSDWARLIQPSAIVKVGANETKDVMVVVAAPQGAVQGDAVDLVVSASKSDDLNVRSLARLFMTVDTKADHADDAAAAAAADELAHPVKATPGLDLVPLMLALGAVAIALRRRA